MKKREEHIKTFSLRDIPVPYMYKRIKYFFLHLFRSYKKMALSPYKGYGQLFKIQSKILEEIYLSNFIFNKKQN